MAHSGRLHRVSRTKWRRLGHL